MNVFPQCLFAALIERVNLGKREKYNESCFQGWSGHSVRWVEIVKNKYHEK